MAKLRHRNGPSRHEIIEAFANCKSLLARYQELADGLTARELVSVRHDLRVAADNFESKTNPLKADA